jgi:hypothetical protein
VDACRQSVLCRRSGLPFQCREKVDVTGEKSSKKNVYFASRLVYYSYRLREDQFSYSFVLNVKGRLNGRSFHLSALFWSKRRIQNNKDHVFFIKQIADPLKTSSFSR